MKTLRKLVVVFGLCFFLAGAFLNSGFFKQKQDEAYAQLKEKYQITTEVAEVQDELEPEIIEEPEATQTENVEVQEVSEVKTTKEETKVDNRTTENIIWDFLKNSGYTDIQTAAIIGNLYQESGLKSSSVEHGTGEGIGIAQWSFGRKQQLKNYAASKGVEWTNLNAQLEFLVKELKSSQFYEPYKSTFANPYSINEAVEAYCFGFERPNRAKANLSYREKMAWQAYYRNVDR